MTDRSMSELTPDGLIAVAVRAYEAMVRGYELWAVQGAEHPDPDQLHEAGAFSRLALEGFCEVRRRQGERVVYEALGRLQTIEPGALRFLAAQAVSELDELNFSVKVEE